MIWLNNSLTACFPSPLVGEGSSAPSRSDGAALREGGFGPDAAKLLTPLRALVERACSPPKGERNVAS